MSLKYISIDSCVLVQYYINENYGPLVMNIRIDISIP